MCRPKAGLLGCGVPLEVRMNPIQRAQDILLKPKDTWPQIAQEAATTQSLYLSLIHI